MERLLLLIGGGLTLLILVYVSVVQFEEPSQDLSKLSSIVPDDAWYKENVIDSDVPVLVEFTATWCGYCKQLAVVLKDVEKNYGDQIKIVPVDVDEHPLVSQAYGIDGLPSIMVVKDKQVVAFAPGMMRYETVEKLIQPHIDSKAENSSKTEAAPITVTPTDSVNSAAMPVESATALPAAQ